MTKTKLGLMRQVLADNIRRFRRELGINQEELAHRANIHRTYMSSIERARQNISIDSIERIAKALEIEPHRLLMDR
jgi:transcriptional regulator with XRE-family HTH domain